MQKVAKRLLWRPYDAYIKAFRWSSDRLNADKGGIVCLFLMNMDDGNGMDGFRKNLEKNFLPFMFLI